MITASLFPSLFRHLAMFATVVVAAFLFDATALAEGKTLVNVDKAGLAVQGYDVVAFFTDGKPVKGASQFASSYGGANYYFASAEHKSAFDKEPAKYAPQFGGYCAFGASKNKLVSIEVDAFQVVNGRLLLQYDKGIRDKFNKDTAGNLKLADTNWPGLVSSKGK
ncbi:MAG: YHS domain-containing (seleno)protein [Chthoniobacter sp.]|uniref:YHS domain-containing (seleno)protein n=1 Tax=Chthoniobacter sp. TaxID=2510640 RepID=UPI0032AE214B